MAKITYGTTPILSQLTIIAKEKNFFRKNDIEIDFRNFVTGRKSMQALQKGWIDVANVIDANVAVLAGEHKPKVKILTCTQTRTDGTILARQDKGVTSPQSLIGKKIGYMRGTSSHMFILYFCRHFGLDFEALDLIPVRTDQMEKALLRGEIDACSIWEPFSTQTKIAAGVAEIPLTMFENEGYYKLRVMLAANIKALKNKKQEIEAIMHTLGEAETFAAENPDETSEIVAKALGLPLQFYKDIEARIPNKLCPVDDEFWEQVRLHVGWLGYDLDKSYEKFIDRLTRLD